MDEKIQILLNHILGINSELFDGYKGVLGIS